MKNTWRGTEFSQLLRWQSQDQQNCLSDPHLTADVSMGTALTKNRAQFTHLLEIYPCCLEPLGLG